MVFMPNITTNHAITYTNSIATRVSMRRVVASGLEDNAFDISSADYGADAARSLSKIPNSQAAKSVFESRKPFNCLKKAPSA